MTDRPHHKPSKGRSADASEQSDQALRDRVADLEQQVTALRFAADQGDLVREQFADLYDYAPVGYLTVDAEGAIRRVNVPAAALLGGSRQDLANRKLVTLVRPADKARFIAFLEGAFTASSPASVEVGLVRGKWRAEHLQFVAAPAAGGRDLGHPGAQARLAVLDVTERWRAEEALRESRDRFQAVVASMAEGVVVHDATGAIRECNTAAQRILGLSEDEILGRRSVDPHWQAIHEDGTPFAGEQHPAMVVLRSGVSQWNVPMGVHRPDGSVVWLRVNADPLRNADGSVRGAVATFSDVTAERQRAAERAELLERLSFVIDGSDDGFWDWDVATGAVTFSRRWAQMFGYDVAELEPGVATWERMVHPEDRNRAWSELRRHLAGEVDQHVVETRLRHRDGHWVRVVVRGKVVARDAAGAPLRMAGTYSDVTRRAEMEQALAASEKRFQDLVSGMRDGLVVLQDGGVVFANPAAARLHGLEDPSAMRGFPAREFVDAASLSAIEETDRRLLAGEAVAPVDVTVQARGGAARVAEALASVVPFGGRPAIQVVLRDVTEQRALQARLMASSKLEALGTFVGGMAHEINNPLAAEMAQSGIAADLVRDALDRIAAGGLALGGVPVSLLDEALDALHEARESTQRIAAIVRDLVKLGRQDRGAERLRLRSVVDDALRWLSSPRHAGVVIRVEDAGAPDVTGVESQILQVIVALLTNARQSIPAGRGGVVTVRLGPGGPGGSRIEVEDDGAGMTAEVLARAFDPFFTTRDVGQGVGLGLSVAHAIATAHGGTLTATSRPGAGSTFRLELPAAASPEDGEVVTPG